MRSDFGAFILSHGRPHQVSTYKSLLDHGYSGKIYVVIDDEDEYAAEYHDQFGDAVLVFSKDEIAQITDSYDNTSERRGVLWARNACWELARRVGCRYFIQLDDDYLQWSFRRVGKGHRLSTSGGEEYHEWRLENLDTIFTALVRLIETTPVKTVALAQGGDYIGGVPRHIRFKRKAMNTFVCDTTKPFLFSGRLNEDVNTYVSLGHRGDLFFTDMMLQMHQSQTQSQSGGMSEVYKREGTYVKSFYTIMAAPSCVTIRSMGNADLRLHHRIDWNKAVPKILRS